MSGAHKYTISQSSPPRVLYRTRFFERILTKFDKFRIGSKQAHFVLYLKAEQKESVISMENKAALVFGGQGAQFTKMGKKIYESSEKAKAVFNLASFIVGYDVAKMCFEAPQEELSKTIYCQICTLTVELAIYEVFKEKNIPFHAVAGFSLGEYAALVAVGVFDMKTAFELVKARAIAMETKVDNNAGRMAAIINLAVDQIELLCE